MSKTTTPLLDYWAPPPDAGRPVAVLATTFVLQPDFVDRDCLSRFLSVNSVEESLPGSEEIGADKPTSRSVDDIVARLELEERLADAAVTVIADRSAEAHRSTLRWDLLQVAVPGGALLHSKVSVLIWENCARVIIGSANLTRAGYRTQAELALAAEVRSDTECLLPRADLLELADELESYLDLLPGQPEGIAAVERARSTLAIFRVRIDSVPVNRRRSSLRVRLAPTSPQISPLDRFADVWRGDRKATEICQVSPFYDAKSDAAGDAIRSTVIARNGAGRHEHLILTLPTLSGTLPVSEPLLDRADRGLLKMLLLDDPSSEQRRQLHAKCLTVTGPDGTAVLVGSSNHTSAGLGVGGQKRHRELNVWLHARAGTREERRLWDLTPVGEPVPAEQNWINGDDEDEAETPQLPLAFQQVIARRDEEKAWTLTCTVDTEALDKVGQWLVADPTDTPLMNSAQWHSAGRPDKWTSGVASDDIPTSLAVTTSDGTARWSVLVDDRGELPPGPTVKDLTTAQLLAALARGRTLSAAVAEILAGRLASADPLLDGDDVLARYDDPALLFRRGRALGAALDQLEERLARRLNEVDPVGHLSSRLRTPPGPLGLAERILVDVDGGLMEKPEAVFTLAEVALAMGRVDWQVLLAEQVRGEGADGLSAAFDGLEQAIDQLGLLPRDLHDYARAAVERSRQCLNTLSGN
ncbi:hypothetical protein SAMN06265174_103316 [Dietzia kunjamensis subsp. schimae]|uniref:PLD phosphodiesterase domain-containing protein n=1 Tax=Dietzia kunjamensis subsp. schimae TaxID=498198 RepID=A0ABY1N0S2_9ACTN|nr:hypothetical protein [Dietzia kunjamensis]MBB1015019.1 hypothetical protein [Dietzia kunjamensis subsp. schimae]SMO67978.1 hypothetical protein SAMN06265174_103316 [Dietzia kunjamensis subsp. schimae]